MGRDKALLPVPPDGRPLLAHVVARLAPLEPAALVVVTNNPELPALAALPGAPQFVVDAYPDTGTLGGIATGLRHTPEWALVVACDLPLVSAALCRFLWAIAQEEGNGASDRTDRWDAIVPVVGGYEEPLHALYHARCLPAIEARLAQGQRRVISFLADVRTRYVGEDELRRVDPDLHSFVNANTPEEWATARDLLLRELKS